MENLGHKQEWLDDGDTDRCWIPLIDCEVDGHTPTMVVVDGVEKVTCHKCNYTYTQEIGSTR